MSNFETGQLEGSSFSKSELGPDSEQNAKIQLKLLKLKNKKRAVLDYLNVNVIRNKIEA